MNVTFLVCFSYLYSKCSNMLNPDTKYITLNEGAREITLRRSLFWDIPDGGINLERNKRLIIERVFSRGNIEEFKQINRVYSDNQIKQIVVQIGSFDRKTINFISKSYQINSKDFRCFTKKL